jgi:hypothetical protein
MRFLSKPSLGPADKRQRVLDYLSREIAAFGTTLGSERLVNDVREALLHLRITEFWHNKAIFRCRGNKINMQNSAAGTLPL